jgi:arylsulfatase
LYLDPKEQIPSHHGFEWGYPRAINLVRYHMGTFKKYPVKDIGLNVP